MLMFNPTRNLEITLHFIFTVSLQARSTLGIAWSADGGEAAAAAAEQVEEHFRKMRVQRCERTLRSCEVPSWTEEEFLSLAPLFHTIWANSSIREAFDQRNRLITEDFVSTFITRNFSAIYVHVNYTLFILYCSFI